jgi:hypothetical protein
MGLSRPLCWGPLFSEAARSFPEPTVLRQPESWSVAERVASWSLCFAEPIVLGDGVKLTTLRDAIAHRGKAIDMPAVLTAAEI